MWQERPGWVEELESHLPLLQSELSSFLASGDPNLWTSLGAYKGLDTGWHQIDLGSYFEMSRLGQDAFPDTCGLLRRLAGEHLGPRHVAIARQDPGLGIGEHCDMHNWILTLHLPLLHDGIGCGIVVDGVDYDWKVGEGRVMDTSFLHSTYNKGGETMYLLLVDFWHSGMSGLERGEMEGFWRATTGRRVNEGRGEGMA